MDFKVSVIICCYTLERLADLREAVTSVQNQTLKPHEIIVAVDHNKQLLNRLTSAFSPEVKVVLNNTPFRGSSGTDNVGITCATGDIIAFIDDDAVADVSWLEHLLEPFQERNMIAVGGQLVPLWSNKRPFWFGDELNWMIGCTYKGHPQTRTEIRAPIFCNASLRREAFDAAGLFPTETGRINAWGTGFEAHFFLRLKYLMPDRVVLYEPSAVVYHKVSRERTTMKYSIKRCYNEGYHKAKIDRAYGSYLLKNLATERSYLNHLLFCAIPQKLRHFYKLGNITQAATIMLCISIVGLGYLVGLWQNARKMNRGI